MRRHTSHLGIPNAFGTKSSCTTCNDTFLEANGDACRTCCEHVPDPSHPSQCLNCGFSDIEPPCLDPDDY